MVVVYSPGFTNFCFSGFRNSVARGRAGAPDVAQQDIATHFHRARRIPAPQMVRSLFGDDDRADIGGCAAATANSQRHHQQ